MSADQVSYPLQNSADVGSTRRAAVERSKRLGFDETVTGRVALVVTEAATNIIKHARKGEIVIGQRGTNGSRGIEILALDRGPGMADVDRCMEDGFSTAGSAGTGLGAMKRMCSTFEIYSLPALGTGLLLRVDSGPSPRPRGPRVGAVSVPIRGEDVCGDQWTVIVRPERVVLLVVDGLGHGKLAFEAAHKATQVASENADEAPDQLLQRVHAALRSTRGAAGAVAVVSFSTRTVRYAGIGNISGILLTAQTTRGMVSQNGTLGGEVRRFQIFDYPLAGGAHVVMHSDGLSTHLDPQRYPGLLARDPSLIAGVLYRDHVRGRDDATIVVLSEELA